MRMKGTSDEYWFRAETFKWNDSRIRPYHVHLWLIASSKVELCDYTLQDGAAEVATKSCLFEDQAIDWHEINGSSEKQVIDSLLSRLEERVDILDDDSTAFGDQAR